MEGGGHDGDAKTSQRGVRTLGTGLSAPGGVKETHPRSKEENGE